MSSIEPTAATRPLPDAAPKPPPPSPTGRALAVLWWSVRFLFALFLFVGALQVMRTGASGLDLLRSGGVLVENWASTLGLGWIGALLVLSGSPIAASALTLVEGGAISQLEGFTMLAGSRLGAAFVVLLVAVVYATRGGEGRRLAPVSTAVMALVMTAVIYVPGSLIGYLLLEWEPFTSLEIRFPTQFGDLIDFVYGNLITRMEAWPGWLLFIGGLGILLASFKLIDSVVPELDQENIEGKRLGRLRRKWPMFALGCLVALVAMSVSVALTVLVPLVSKGYAKREDILPYIMGANITTLGDTLLAAFLLGSAAAVQIVVAGIVGTTIVSVLLLAFAYPQMRRAIWRFQRQMVKSKSMLAAFTAALFLVPIAVIAMAAALS